jgi:hypothetical protein
MPYVGDNPNLECHTARYQLGQARKFLDDMMKPEIFNDDEKFDRALFGFCNAVGSAIDYVSADFIYNKVRFENDLGNLERIDWRKFSRGRNDQDDVIDNHPEKIAIKKFRGEYKNKKDILLKVPLVNYFYGKRQKWYHVGWDGVKWSTFSGEQGNQETGHRGLENSFWFELHQKHPEDSLLMFDDCIPIDKQVETLKILTDDNLDIKKIGNQVCDKIEEFIDYFDGKDYFT